MADTPAAEMRRIIVSVPDLSDMILSRPGLFAVGDLRSGSMKRVASAVGEGSAAIRSVPEPLSAPT